MTVTDLRLEYKNATGTYPGNNEEKACQNDFRETKYIDMIDYVKWLESKICEIKNEKV